MTDDKRKFDSNISQELSDDELDNVAAGVIFSTSGLTAATNSIINKFNSHISENAKTKVKLSDDGDLLSGGPGHLGNEGSLKV